MTTDVEQDRVWTRPFVAAMVVNLALCLNFFIVVPVTVLLVAHRFDASLTMGGLAAGALLAGGVCARPFAGIVLAGRSARAASAIASATMAAAALLCLLPVDLATFIALRFLTGVAFGLGSTAVTATAVSSLPVSRRGEGTGYFGLSNSLAGALGPATSLLLAQTFGYDAVLWAVGGCALLGAVTAAGMSAAAESVESLPPVRGLRRFVEPTVFPLCAVIFLVGTAYSGLFGFVEAYTTGLGLAESGPAFFLAYAVMVMAMRPLAGRLMDRRGVAVVMVPAMIIFAGGLVLLASARSFTAVVAAGLLCGVALGTILASATALAAGLAPPGRLAVSLSTFYLALDAAVALGPVWLGMLAPSLGYPGLFRVLAGVALLGLVAFVTGHLRGRLVAVRVR